MSLLKYAGLGLLALLVVATLLIVVRFVTYGAQSRSMTPELGVHNGRFVDCADKPNCVNSYSSDKRHRIEPISGSHGTLALIASYLSQSKGVEVVVDSDDYLYVQVRSVVFGFVDDLEFYFDGAVVQVRSASRVGYSDLNANRRRVEEIRKVVSGRY